MFEAWILFISLMQTPIAFRRIDVYEAIKYRLACEEITENTFKYIESTKMHFCPNEYLSSLSRNGDCKTGVALESKHLRI